jgi:hypothetical protein
VNGEDHPDLAVVLDVNDLERASTFWSAALGFPVQRPSSALSGTDLGD